MSKASSVPSALIGARSTVFSTPTPSRLQVGEQLGGEVVGVLAVHEVTAAHLLDDVVGLEHAAGGGVVGRADHRIVEAGERDGGDLDRLLEERLGAEPELAVVAEGGIEAGAFGER